MTAAFLVLLGAGAPVVTLIFLWARSTVTVEDHAIVLQRLPGFGEPVPLRGVAREFLSFRCPQALLVSCLAFWAARFWVGDWSLWDLLVIGGMLAAWPFVEWFSHFYFLHSKPFRLLGKEIHSIVARTHRAHHHNPWDPKLGLTPAHILVVYIAYSPLFWHLVLPAPLAWTVSATLVSLLLNYEWVHFLIHTSYKPKTRLFKRIWRHHRLHHFKSEHHWYGVTMTAADRVLQTMPQPADTPSSGTCLTLGDEEKLKGYSKAA